jgi:ABC-type bacteriocin/lantibiotic exporter with double-glycine peptidase domain
MVEATQGLPGEEILFRLLEGDGTACTLLEARERLGFNPTVEGLAEAIREQGRSARSLQIRSGDLAFLKPGTLLATRDGRWLVFGAWITEGCRVETSDGERTLAQAALDEVLSWTILDLTKGLPAEGHFWGRLGRYVLEFRKPLATLGMTSLAMQVLALSVPLLTALAMNQALPNGASSLLGLVALGVLCAASFQALLGWVRQRTLLFLETSLEISTQRSFLEHLLALPFPTLDRKGRAELLQAFLGLDAARGQLTDRLLGSALDGVMAFLYLMAMIAVFPGGALAVLLVALAMAAMAVTVGRLQARQQGREVVAQGRQRGFLMELLTGIPTLKAAGAETWVRRRWLAHLAEELSISLRRQRLGLWSELGLDALRQGVLMGILLWGGQMVLQGDFKVGTLMAFVQMTSSFLGAGLALAGAYLTVVILRPQVAKAVEIFETEAPAPAPRLGLNALPGPLVMDQVSFRYAPAGPWILKDFSLTVEPGSRRWIQAPSGSGKSTLLRVLAGLYPPERGLVSLGGLKPAEAKELILYLPQSVQLYGGTLKDNLRLLSCHAPWDRIEGAAETSGLAKWMESLPMRDETLVNPGGGTLSGGQRQLVALTAAMASDRCLLLLDEAMANLDWQRRSVLATSEWFSGKTLIYASHDVSFAASETVRLLGGAASIPL